MKVLRHKILFIPIFLALIPVSYFILQPWSPLSRTILGHLASSIHDMNKFSLKVSQDILEEKIQIEWNNLLIFDGEHFIQSTINRQRYGYGENTFTVKYDSVIIGELVQYKYNNWHYHKYVFNIFTKENSVHLDTEIIGPDTAFWN